MGHSIRASTISQTKLDKGKQKILPEPKSLVGGKLANLNKKRRYLILPDTSPSSEEEARTRQPAVKATLKPTKVKSDRDKGTKFKTLEKGKAKEPLQEGIPNPPSTKVNLPHEADVHPELSTDVGYDEP